VTEVDLYHDESKQGGFWHGVLLVPDSARSVLLSRLATAREKTRFAHLVEIKKTKERWKKIHCLESWVSIAVASLISHGSMAFNDGDGMALNDSCYGLRFAVLHSPDNFAGMSTDPITNVQTTLRITVKGLLNYASTIPNFEPITVRRMVLHGDKHYAGRLDPDRVIGRLRGELRPHITLSDDIEVNAIGNDHRKSGAEVDDCHLLQLTDCLIGGTRILGTDPSHHLRVGKHLHSLEQLVARWEEGEARMRNSRFGRNFTWSAFTVDHDGFHFTRGAVARVVDARQLSIF
jgi:hypothetical protein